jgi:hyperosmotically inducible periplasmic protein
MNGRRYLSWRLFAASAATLGAISLGHGAEGARTAENPLFQKLDVNRDGYVSREEARKLKNFDQAFTEADENRDGKLDPDEFVRAQSIYERQRAAQYLEDSFVTARIKAALFKDPHVSGLDVKVETHHGLVLLSGFVNDEKQARRAAEIASSVRGVTAIKSSLVVKD